MNKTRLFKWTYLTLLVVLTACQGAEKPLSIASSEPAAAPDGMSLTTGAADATPIWGYCSPSHENTHIRTYHCQAPVWQTLAVGHLFLLTELAPMNRGESELVWDLAIDDYIVDLASFGTYDYVMPAMPASPSPVREVFAKMTDWNLVMTNLNPGQHTLSFRARNDTESYMWLVYIVIEGEEGTDISAVPFPLHS